MSVCAWTTTLTHTRTHVKSRGECTFSFFHNTRKNGGRKKVMGKENECNEWEYLVFLTYITTISFISPQTLSNLAIFFNGKTHLLWCRWEACQPFTLDDDSAHKVVRNKRNFCFIHQRLLEELIVRMYLVLNVMLWCQVFCNCRLLLNYDWPIEMYQMLRRKIWNIKKQKKWEIW